LEGGPATPSIVEYQLEEAEESRVPLLPLLERRVPLLERRVPLLERRVPLLERRVPVLLLEEGVADPTGTL
jgi:hypothetical protein